MFLLITLSSQLIFSILLHIHISKASNLLSVYVNVHVSAAYSATLQTIILFFKSRFILPVDKFFFSINSFFTMSILLRISFVQYHHHHHHHHHHHLGLVIDVAVYTSSRQAVLFCVRRYADARPRLNEQRSHSTVCSHVCLGRPGLVFQFFGRPETQVRNHNAREWSGGVSFGYVSKQMKTSCRAVTAIPRVPRSGADLEGRVGGANQGLWGTEVPQWGPGAKPRQPVWGRNPQKLEHF